MTKARLVCLSAAIALLLASCASASAAPAASTDARQAGGASVVRDGFSLTWSVLPGASIDDAVKARFTDEFFAVYPLLRERFNPRAPRAVTIAVDPSYAGAANTLGNRVTYSARFLAGNPEDSGSFVHELGHVVQAYPAGTDWWLVEGMAEYVRYRYARGNAATQWLLLPPFADSKVQEGYRVTGRFIAWLESRGSDRVVERLDAALRKGSYRGGFWAKETGKDLDAWWSEYLADPSLGEPGGLCILPVVESQGYRLELDAIGTPAAEAMQGLSSSFSALYPKVARRFGTKAPKTLRVLLENDPAAPKSFSPWPAYFIFNAAYWNKPEDESLNVSFNFSLLALAPEKWEGWLTGSIVEYCAYRYGMPGGLISLPPPAAGDSYEKGFYVGARFLGWLEAGSGASSIDELARFLFAGTYSADTWKQLFHASLEELWQSYLCNPSIAASP